MKKAKILIGVLSLMLGLMVLGTSCSGEAQTNNPNSKYMCPMECEGSSVDEPGQCPVCEMDLVLRSEYQGGSGHEEHGHDGHEHEIHEGHDHESHEGHDHEGHDHDGHSH